MIATGPGGLCHCGQMVLGCMRRLDGYILGGSSVTAFLHSFCLSPCSGFLQQYDLEG